MMDIIDCFQVFIMQKKKKTLPPDVWHCVKTAGLGTAPFTDR